MSLVFPVLLCRQLVDGRGRPQDPAQLRDHPARAKDIPAGVSTGRTRQVSEKLSFEKKIEDFL